MYSEHLRRRDNIIITAIDLLDEVGVQGMTTKEIAKRQHITEPAIYKQFTGKKEIILTILQKFSDFDKSIYNTVIEQNMSCRKGLVYFMSTYAEYYQSYPQISTVLLSYDMFKYDSITNEKMKNIINERRNLLSKIILAGQEEGGFSKRISADDAAEVILGILISTTYNWKMDNCSFSLKEKLLKVFDICIGNWLL